MTATEAIEREIEREEKELAPLRAEMKRLALAMTREDPNEPSQLLHPMVALLRRVIELEQVIVGKRTALESVQENAEDPLHAIDAEIEMEERRADVDGRRAERLREEALQAERDGRSEEAKQKRAEATRLGDEFDRELARIRGKNEARRAAAGALRG